MQNTNATAGAMHGKIVIVTGAGSGVGRALAVGFCRDGAQVLGIGRTEQSLAETARLCPTGSMHYITGSIANRQDVQRLFNEAIQRHGRVDILVNNAALYPKVNFLESNWADWAGVIETNVLGTALCCREALPIMLRNGHGRIINIGTFAWRGPIPGASAYSVSKAAVPVLTKALACEIDRDRYPDVLVNELVPGMYKTGMSDMGEEPEAAYAHVKHIACLPAGGPTGATFVRSELWIEHNGIRAKIKRHLKKFLGR